MKVSLLPLLPQHTAIINAAIIDIQHSINASYIITKAPIYTATTVMKTPFPLLFRSCKSIIPPTLAMTPFSSPL